MHTYLKHFDAYSTETNRMHSDFNISQFDFWDTYVRPFYSVLTSALFHDVPCVTARAHRRHHVTPWPLILLRYLPQYKMAFTEANASGAMCSYTVRVMHSRVTYERGHFPECRALVA